MILNINRMVMIKIKFIFVILLIMSIVSCGNQSTKEHNETAQERRSPKSGFILHFEEDTHNFGTIDATKKENEFLSTEFVFVNHNDDPLLIMRADVSCSCLSVEIPDKPVLSGEKGIVKVTVDTKQVNGWFSRNVFIRSNAENDVELLKVAGIVNK
jgi:hypothetical protein